MLPGIGYTRRSVGSSASKVFLGGGTLEKRRWRGNHQANIIGITFQGNTPNRISWQQSYLYIVGHSLPSSLLQSLSTLYATLVHFTFTLALFFPLQSHQLM